VEHKYDEVVVCYRVVVSRRVFATLMHCGGHRWRDRFQDTTFKTAMLASPTPNLT